MPPKGFPNLSLKPVSRNDLVLILHRARCGGRPSRSLCLPEHCLLVQLQSQPILGREQAPAAAGAHGWLDEAHRHRHNYGLPRAVTGSGCPPCQRVMSRLAIGVRWCVSGRHRPGVRRCASRARRPRSGAANPGTTVHAENADLEVQKLIFRPRRKIRFRRFPSISVNFRRFPSISVDFRRFKSFSVRAKKSLSATPDPHPAAHPGRRPSRCPRPRAANRS